MVKKCKLDNKPRFVNHDRQTRNNDGLKIKLPIPKNQHIRHAPFYVEYSIWNTLPLQVREMDLDVFKKEVKTRLKNGQIVLGIDNY